MSGSPSKEGGTGNAAHKKLLFADTLFSPQQKINSARFGVWEKEAQRLLREFLVTRRWKHFDAFATHVSRMRARLAGRSAP
jgi:hypothetical protein